MKMDDVEEISNSELRKRLTSYGVTVGPVTSTTRKLLERKLKKFEQSSSVPVEPVTNGGSSGGAGTPSEKEKPASKSNSRRSSAGRRSSKKFAAYSSDEDEVVNGSRKADVSVAPPPINVSTPPRQTKPSTNNEFVDPNDVLIPTTPAAASPAVQVRSRRSINNTTINNEKALKPLVNEFSDDEEPPTRKTESPRVPQQQQQQQQQQQPPPSSSATSYVNGATDLSNTGGLSNGCSSRLNNHDNEDDEQQHKQKQSLPQQPQTKPKLLMKPSSKPMKVVHSFTNPVRRSTPPRFNSTTTQNTEEDDENTSSSKTKSDLPDDVQEELNSSLASLRNAWGSKHPSPNRNSKQSTIPEESESGDEDVGGEHHPLSHRVRSLLRRGWDAVASWRMLILLAVVFAFTGVYLQNRSNNRFPSITASVAANTDAEDTAQQQLNDHRIINCLYQRLSVLAGDAECGDAPSKWIAMSDLPEFSLPCIQEGDNSERIGSLISSTYYSQVGNGHAPTSILFVG